MRKLAPFLMLAVFAALLVPRMMQSMAQGDVYPEWSTLRSDPMGAKVLYLSLARMGAASRSYEPWKEAAPQRAQYVWLGSSPLLLTDAKELEKLLAAGGVAMVVLRPATEKSLLRTEKLGFLQAPKAGLVLKGEEWKCLEGSRENCALAERSLGQGRVWVVADGSPLRNGELQKARRAEWVARLFGTGLPVVFDESHLGVSESGGVGVLLRRYRLFPAIGLMLGAALLFVWRSSVSLLPERAPVTPAMAPEPAASLRTLLAQRVPRGELLATLVDEWKRALPLLPVWHRGRREEMEAALERARARKDIRQGYEELQAAIQLRKGSV